MAINVYGWRKPTLELELVEGGSLLANTKYYVTGFMRYNPATYNSVGSPLSDVYEITTTSTAKSIKITQKTYRDITAFVDNGDGKTLVNCYRHCLVTGDVIKIDTGNYIGTWTVTKVNYHSFTIDTAFAGTETIQCYTDSYRYNYPDYGSGNRGVGMLYWIYTTSPYDVNGLFISVNRWTETVYQWVYSIQNPVTITTQPTGSPSSGHENLQVRHFNTGLYKEVAENNGAIHVDVQDNGTTTLLQIRDAVKEAGFELNCNYSAKAGINAINFMLIGNLFLGGTSTLSVAGANMTFILSEIFHINDYSKMIFEGCLMSMMPVSFTAQYKFTANNCIIFNKGSSNNYGSWVYGDNTIFYAFPRPSYSAGACDIPNLKYNNLSDGTQDNYGIIQNKKYYNNPNDTVFFQNSYNNNKLINCEVPSLYWILLPNKNCIPDIYMCENISIRKTGYPWDYRFFTETTAFNHHFKFLNINVQDNADNIKRCIHNYIIPSTAYVEADFYRRLKLYIKNQLGQAVEDAIISIVDNVGNTYSGTTDASGYSSIDCLEQKTYFTNEGSRSSWNPDSDTFYTGFTITITKAGYENEIIKLDKLYQEGQYNTILYVSLKGNSYSKSRIVNALS